MSLDLEKVTYVLNKYYSGYVWSAAGIITDNDPEFDEFGNIVNGLNWDPGNSIPRPTVEELTIKWNTIESQGEFRQKWPPLSTTLNRWGDHVGIWATTKDYASMLLRESDFAALPDVGLANQAEWDAYRSALRDIRSNPVKEPNWPIKPAVIYQ